MKYSFKQFLVLLLIFALGIPLLGQNQPKKVLKVGVYENPPKIFTNPSGKADGIFIEILNEIAIQEHYKIEYVYGNWFELIEKLKAGSIDLIPDVAYTKERDSLFTFHKLYILNSWLEVFTLKEKRVETISVLNGKTIGVLKGSIQESYLKESFKTFYKIEYQYKVYNDYPETMKALQDHEIDAIIANRFLYYSSIFDDNIVPTGIILKPSDLYFAFRKNISSEVVNNFDKQIAKMKNDPKSVFYKSIHKWLEKDVSPRVPRFIFWIFGIIIGIGLFIAFFIIILRKKVKEKTQELNIMNKELLYAKVQAEESDLLKTAFLENISHEIRTPLNVICGFSNLLNEEQLSHETITEYSKIIQNSSDQLLHILTNIITIASIETNQEKLHFTKFHLNSMMDEIKNFFEKEAKAKHIDFDFHFSVFEKNSDIVGDRSKILQIVHHLVHNAIKFTETGKVVFGYKFRNKEIEFFVTDTGIGISEEQQGKIFERFTQANPFVQVNYGGTGLGLPIAKGLVLLLGGRIWVESKLGVGSTFYFTIPVI